MGTSLDPLISFAKEVLAGKEHQFKYFPVYLKATGASPKCAGSGCHLHLKIDRPPHDQTTPSTHPTRACA